MSAVPAREEMSREERAGDWCARLASASLSAAEQAEFDSWLAADPENSRAFDRTLSVWQGLHEIANAPELIAMRAEALNALREANRRRWSLKVANRLKWPVAVAASLVLVLASSLLLILNQPRDYRTGIGERRSVILEDGSQVSLDADTEIKVAFKSGQRALTLLVGRAKFDVAKDVTRPFTVTAGDQTVVATGTSFSVERLANQVQVIVYEGHVAVLPEKHPAVDELKTVIASSTPAVAHLQPGAELVASLDKPGGSVSTIDMSRTLAWEGGQLNFADEPLVTAAERLNRYSNEKLIVADQRAGAIRVSGVFNAGDTDAFVGALESAFPVEARRERDRIILSSRAS